MKNEKRHMGDIGHMPLGGQEAYQEMLYSGASCGPSTRNGLDSNGRKDGSRGNVHTVFERPSGSNKTNATNRQKPKKRK
tara:strand:- start:682 stop:918 length:237 start_codon:yes stop_codon:yes gene_type:complete